MNKVQMTAEQVAGMESMKKAIDDPNEEGVFKSILSALSYKQAKHGFCEERACLDQLSDEDFLNAFAYGYELHKSVGQKIKDLHDRANNFEVAPHGFRVNKDDYNFGILRALDEIKKMGVDIYNLK